MKTRDKIIVVAVSVSVVVAVGVTLGIVLPQKGGTGGKEVDGNGTTPPQQGDKCPSNTVCVSETCQETPMEGRWRLVGGENRDIQVFDGDQEFDLNYDSTNSGTGAQVYKSSVNSGSFPVTTIHFKDFIDATGDRVIGIWGDARIYSLDYQSYEPGDGGRYRYATSLGGDLGTDVGTSFYTLAAIPPTSPDFNACVEIDSIDFGALCGNNPSCMHPDMPLYLERVQ